MAGFGELMARASDAVCSSQGKYIPQNYGYISNEEEHEYMISLAANDSYAYAIYSIFKFIKLFEIKREYSIVQAVFHLSRDFSGALILTDVLLIEVDQMRIVDVFKEYANKEASRTADPLDSSNGKHSHKAENSKASKQTEILYHKMSLDDALEKFRSELKISREHESTAQVKKTIKNYMKGDFFKFMAKFDKSASLSIDLRKPKLHRRFKQLQYNEEQQRRKVKHVSFDILAQKSKKYIHEHASSFDKRLKGSPQNHRNMELSPKPLIRKALSIPKRGNTLEDPLNTTGTSTKQSFRLRGNKSAEKQRESNIRTSRMAFLKYNYEKSLMQNRRAEVAAKSKEKETASGFFFVKAARKGLNDGG